MRYLSPFTNWFFKLFQPLMIDPLTTSAAIMAGTKLFGSIFGGGGTKTPKEAREARKMLLAFARGESDDLFPEQDILSKAFGSISSRIGRQKEGASAKFASLGLDPRSGLAQQGLSGIQRTEAGLRGKTRADVSIAKSRSRMDALRALLGLPEKQTGLDVPSTIASIGGDVGNLLALKSILKS